MKYNNIIAVTNRNICLKNYCRNSISDISYLTSEYYNKQKSLTVSPDISDSINRISPGNIISCFYLLHQIKKLTEANIQTVILREKDIPESDYCRLAESAIRICENTNTRLILHTFVNTAVLLDYKYIHLPLWKLQSSVSELTDFRIIGASVHSREEALLAEELGADYITAGHIFTTDCKKDLPARGLSFLKEICKAVTVPVYAIGGINTDNLSGVIAAGAKGGCMMSGMMGKL